MNTRHRQTGDRRTDFSGEAAEALRKDKPERAIGRLAHLLHAAIEEGEEPETLRALCHVLERALMRARLTISDGNPRGWTGVSWNLERVKPAATALLGAYIVMDTARAIEMMEDIEAVLADAGSWREDWDGFRDRNEPPIEAVALTQLLSLGLVPRVQAYLEARLRGASEVSDESLRAVESALHEILNRHLQTGEYEQAFDVLGRVATIRSALLAALPQSIFDPHWSAMGKRDLALALRTLELLAPDTREHGEETLIEMLVDRVNAGDKSLLKEGVRILGESFIWKLFDTYLRAAKHRDAHDLATKMDTPLQFQALVELHMATDDLDALEVAFERWHEFEKDVPGGGTASSVRLSSALQAMVKGERRQHFKRLLALGEARDMISSSQLASHYAQLAAWDLADKNAKAAAGNWRKYCTLAEGTLSARDRSRENNMAGGLLDDVDSDRLRLETFPLNRSLGKEIATALFADGDVESGLAIASSVMAKDKEYLEFLLSHARAAVRNGAGKNAMVLTEAAEDLARVLEEFGTLTATGNLYIRMGQISRGRAAQAEAKKLDEEAERRRKEEEDRRRWEDDDD
jgi:hypothetical protein